MVRDDIGLVIAPYAVGLLVAQYTCIFLAASTLYSDSRGCVPSQYSGAWQAWQRGLCLTPEQVWCRAHGSKHINCATADCRAEEIRLSLFRSSGKQMLPSLTPMYSGCSADQVAELVAHMRAMNGSPRGGHPWASCGACVPETDARAAYLPTCTEEQAFCRGLHYRPPASSNASSWQCRQQPRVYLEVARRRNGDYGCLADTPGGTGT